MTSSDWTLFLLCDSAFPAGAFAHSGGLEAAWQAGEIVDADGLARWTETALRQTASAALPLVSGAWSAPDSIEALDHLCDAFLLNHVANRASRAQGQAFLMACAKTFDLDGIQRLATTIRRQRLAGHFAPVFGAAGRALELPQRRTCELLLFLTLRGAISSAVRLGIVGPLQGQKLQHRLAAPLDALVDKYLNLPPEMITQTAPLADLLQGMQDRLYSRLFVS